MRSADRPIAVSMFVLLMVFWLGFLVHRAPRFAGSVWGGFFGVTAALCMLIPLAYTVVKRTPRVRQLLTARYSMGSLLRLHVYFGTVGTLLAIVHTGHEFRSTLGMALITSLLLIVFSGFIGHYYLRYVAENVRENESQLSVLWRSLELRSQALASGPLEPSVSMRAAAEVMSLATATAELQYSVRFQQRVRRIFNIWLNVHIACSASFYLLLVLHIWSGIYFGLRWLELARL